MDDLLPEEQRVWSWLAERRFSLDHELKYLPGRKPDFLAERVGDQAAWVEVKRIEADPTTFAMRKASDLLQSFVMPEGLSGQGYLVVSPDVVEQSIQSALKMFQRHAASLRGKKIDAAFVIQEAGRKDETVLDIPAPVPSKLWVVGAGQSQLSVPVNFAEWNDWQVATAEVKDYLESTRRLSWRPDFQCALIVKLKSDDRPLVRLGLHTSVSSSKASSRISSALKEASKQFKQANLERALPGVAFILPDEIFVTSDDVTRAVFGKLTVSFSLKDDETSAPFHGDDGLFRPDKNRNISTVILLDKGGRATSFPNPYAHHPLPLSSGILHGVTQTTVVYVDHRGQVDDGA